MLAEESKASWIEATHFSEGWLNRWNIIRQTRALETDILHITGDIHFRGTRMAQVAAKPSPSRAYHS